MLQSAVIAYFINNYAFAAGFALPQSLVAYLYLEAQIRELRRVVQVCQSIYQFCSIGFAYDGNQQSHGLCLRLLGSQRAAHRARSIGDLLFKHTSVGAVHCHMTSPMLRICSCEALAGADVYLTEKLLSGGRVYHSFIKFRKSYLAV